MKKFFYTLLGGVAVMSIATATGREAIASGINAFRAPIVSEDPALGYLRSNGVVDQYALFNPETGEITLSFTAPMSATWSNAGWDDDPVMPETVDTIKVYRSISNDYGNTTLVKTFVDVPSGSDQTFIDETNPPSGQQYCYEFRAYFGNHEPSYGQTTTVDAWATIDPAENYTVTPGAQGAMKAIIAFDAPTTCNDGKVTITGTIPSIKIERNLYSSYGYGDIIKTYEDVTPGEHIEYTDEDSENLIPGEKYSYRLQITYDDNTTRSYLNNESVLMGPDKPSAPDNVAARLNADGNVVVTWDAPTSGVNSGWFDPTQVRYYVARGIRSGYSWQYTTISGELEECTFTDESITVEGTYRYRVTSTLAGVELDENSYTYEDSEDVVAGPPCKMPFKESWAKSSFENNNWTKSSDWTATSSTSQWSTPYVAAPQDGDGGFLSLPTNYLEKGEVYTITTGRIDFSQAVMPFISLWYFDSDPEKADNIVKAYISVSGGEFTELEDIDFLSGPGLDQWINLTASLEQYVGEDYIQIKLEVTIGDKRSGVAFDNFEIREVKFADVCLDAVSMPARFYPGASMNITLNFSNDGDYNAEPFGIMLYADNAEIGYAECEGVPSNGRASVTIPFTATANLGTGIKTITASAEGMWEPNMENNSASADIEIVALPAVTDIYSDTDTDGQLTIFWDAVAELPFNDGDIDVEEKLEAANHLDRHLDGWTFIDGDGLDTYQLNESTWYEGKGGPESALVLDPKEIGLSWAASAPTEKIIMMFGAQGDTDDWMISPELNGAEQTISYQVTNGSGWTANNYELMVSSTTTAPEAFTTLEKIAVEGTAFKTWETKTHQLPLGTKYFAIHYNHSYGDWLAFTNFKFTTGSGLTSPATQHIGYNLYCDGEKLNAEPVTDTRHTILSTWKAGNYHLTALYNNAESEPSETLYINGSANGIDAADANEGRITLSGRTLVINAAGHYRISDIAGRAIASGNGPARVALQPGTYVVEAAGSTAKIAVR